MSSTGLQRARSAESKDTLAHLLHALNQPLTGLQCSLELSLATPRRPEEYVRTIRDALHLSNRMRALVEAVREVESARHETAAEASDLRLDELLFSIVAELRPVAQANDVNLNLSEQGAVPVRAPRQLAENALFQVLDSALSLARAGSVLEIAIHPETGDAVIDLSWTPGATPKDSPFSRPELGIIVACAKWQQAGGQWNEVRSAGRQTCGLRMKLSANCQPTGGLQ